MADTPPVFSAETAEKKGTAINNRIDNMMLFMGTFPQKG
jgi:hypothetical protein